MQLFESVVSREKVGQNEHPAIITHKNQSRRGSISATKKAPEYVVPDAAAAGATEAFYPELLRLLLLLPRFSSEP
jgi:hypothetical protein